MGIVSWNDGMISPFQARDRKAPTGSLNIPVDREGSALHRGLRPQEPAVKDKHEVEMNMVCPDLASRIALSSLLLLSIMVRSILKYGGGR